MGELNGKALAAIGVGTLFVWSGIKGWSILGTVGDLVAGTKPSQNDAHPLATVDGQGVSAAGGSIAEIALRYQGHAYHFGGAPGKDGTKPWDCSSFVDYVVGVVAGRPIPGFAPGKYDGSFHGPTTGTWAAWSGMTRITKAELGSGDIVVWLGHMGIALSNTTMISALNESEKTRVSPIEGYGNGPILAYGRLK